MEAEVRYRQPATAPLFVGVLVGLFACAAQVFGPDVGRSPANAIVTLLEVSVVVAGVFYLLNRPLGITMSPERLVVRTRRADRELSWGEVVDLTPAPWWAGGIRVTTVRGSWNVPAPCSWWGGPATPAQVNEVRGYLEARRAERA